MVGGDTQCISRRGSIFAVKGQLWRNVDRRTKEEKEKKCLDVRKQKVR